MLGGVGAYCARVRALLVRWRRVAMAHRAWAAWATANRKSGRKLLKHGGGTLTVGKTSKQLLSTVPTLAAEELSRSTGW